MTQLTSLKSVSISPLFARPNTLFTTISLWRSQRNLKTLLKSFVCFPGSTLSTGADSAVSRGWFCLPSGTGPWPASCRKRWNQRSGIWGFQEKHNWSAPSTDISLTSNALVQTLNHFLHLPQKWMQQALGHKCHSRVLKMHLSSICTASNMKNT